MFDGLTQKLGAVFDKLTRRGALTASDVDAAMAEIRLALLEADVALPVVKDLITAIRDKAVGETVLRSVTPGQMVVKIVHDHLVDFLGGGDAKPGLNLNATPPVVMLMVGLQGSGKTTTTAKIARRLKERDRKKVLMASLDTRRPAAQEQLAILGNQIDVRTLPIVPGEPPVAIARRALQSARLEGFDVLMLDSAGRLHVDEDLMQEVASIANVAPPNETLLVVDAMTGQDAVNVAQSFGARLTLTGTVLTRIDGDARGGAALSMRAITGCPIKLLGVGEKLDQLEDFDASRIAGRILGMGDIVGLVEKAAEHIEREEAEELAAKMAKGQFDLNDFYKQLEQLKKMGGLGGVMAMLPGLNKVQKQISAAKIDDSVIGRQQAIINSMTRVERRKPDIIKASRKQRIAAGSGTSVPEVNRLLKQHMEMARMMKQAGKLGQKGLMRHGLSALLPR